MAPEAHPWPAGQSRHGAAPQSVPLSAPFFTPSVQLGAWHVPPEQLLLAQSVAVVQVMPVAHPVHVPPQSTADSVPFLMLSAHVAAWQTPPAQFRLVQSAVTTQLAPAPHPVGHGPPQSTPVSVPSCSPSVQLGALQVPALQTSPEAQLQLIVLVQLSESEPH